MNRSMITRCLTLVLALALLVPALSVYGEDGPGKTLVKQGPLQKINPYFSTQTFTYSDGTSISRNVINGPPRPPQGYEVERMEVALPEPDPAAGTNTLAVPAYEWVFGCSAVSGSMIAAYHDRNGFPDIYTGPTGGGVMPLTEDASWGTWSDGYTTYPNNPLIASHNGLDGRATKGSLDDYWVQYGSGASDPYITGSWTQHSWADAIGDYMKTSQSTYNNTDGSTHFYTWTNGATQLTCTDMEGYAIHTLDGTYGRKLFYEARGYTVTDCYNQKTDNNAGGFTFAMYKAEIDAGRPALLNLNGHSIVGVGYDDATNTVYIHDTWDHSSHTMTWGGSYSGMQLLSVSVVNFEAPVPDLPSVTAINPTSGAAGTSVTITGNHFGATQGTSTVTVNGASATVSAWSNIGITFTVPADPTTGPVIVTTSLGSSEGKTFTVVGPSIATLSPASGAIGTAVNIMGSGFGSTKGSSTVTFNGASAAVSAWSNTLITCTVPVDATTGPVIVTTSGGTSGGPAFAIATPAISSLSSITGPVGTPVTITGSNFGTTQSSSTVRFNGTQATVSAWSNTSITCVVPVGATTGLVTVVTSGGTSAGKTFTVKLPLISGVTPASGTIGAAIKISGNYFGATQGTSTVTFNGVEAVISSWSNTVIMCTVPVGATTGPVLVANPGGNSNAKTFTVKKALISGASPASATIGATVKISGNYFGATQGTSTVTFNGVEADVSSWTNTVIMCTVPVGATTGPVVVTNLAGGSNAKTFTVKLPLISGVTPASGTIGAAVRISGNYFGASQGKSTVTFNGVEADVSSWTNTVIMCTVPVGAATGPVVVTNAAGSSNAKTFTVKP